MKLLIILLLPLLLAFPVLSFANPANSGVTGLLHVPSADTLDTENVCIGLWSDTSEKDGKRASIVPLSLTLGIGSFWEVYGSYPNVVLNGQEPYSGRDAIDLGTKIRFYGKRSSKFKLAADLFAKRHVSDNKDVDGITDLGARLIASLQIKTISFHAFTGYFKPGKGVVPEGNEVLYGGGVEYAPVPRMRLTAEVYQTYKPTADLSVKQSVSTLSPEASVGFQYYLSPHLTFNLSAGGALAGDAVGWRLLTGFTTCQGIGSYVKPVPALTQPAGKDGRSQKSAKQVKILPVSPLLLKSLPSLASVNKLEVPLDVDGEEVIIKPYGQIVIPSQQTINPVALSPRFVPIRPQQAQMGKAVRTQAQQYSAPTPIGEVVVAKTLTQQPAIIPLEDEVKMIPEKGAGEFTLDLQEGVTPLYAIEIKGNKASLVAMLPNDVLEPVGQEDAAQKMTVYRKFRFADGKFEFNMSDLSDEVKKSIAEAAEQIRNDKKWVYLRIDGHTDNMGSINYNMDLSLKRAIAVASYLITKEGINPKKIFVKGMGKTKHIADNSTPEGRRTNRRFEILFLTPKAKQ